MSQKREHMHMHKEDLKKAVNSGMSLWKVAVDFNVKRSTFLNHVVGNHPKKAG